MKETVKQIRQLQPDVMLRCRGIGNYGDYYTPEGFVPGAKENTNMPWMTIYPLGSSFSYDKNEKKYKGTAWIVKNLIDAVAKGGSFMVGIGPDGNGKFHPAAIEQLEATGKWLEINGKGIYNTRARKTWKEGGDIRYTRPKDSTRVFAYVLKWPGETLVLKALKAKVKAGSQIRMFGYPEPLKWKEKNGTLEIIIPANLQAPENRPCQYAWGFELEVE